MADLVTEWFMEPSVRTNYRTMVYYKGDGQDTFEINFDGGFIYKEDVKAFSVKDDTRERKNHKVTFVNGSVSRVKLDNAIPKGWTVCIYRDTPKTKPLAQFTDGAIINEANLDRNAQQAMFAVSEMVDRFDSTVESVEAALQQVYEANKKADQAINTANGAKSTADNAVRIANSAVTTANEAKQSAANANTTAGNAVKTANEAKSIAQGLDDQIKQANTTANNAVTKADSAIKTANEAKATANGIDAKATKALADSAQALQVAHGIDGKATQALNNSKEALDKANAALESQGIAKELTDRVESFQSGYGVVWKGQHTYNGNMRLILKDVGEAFLEGNKENKSARLSFKDKDTASWTFIDLKNGSASVNNRVIYTAGYLGPYFTGSVTVRSNGYYGRYIITNYTNNDKVLLSQDANNTPYFESSSGADGSRQYQWLFPVGGGTVLTDKYFDRFAMVPSDTVMYSPDMATMFTVKNTAIGGYSKNTGKWLFVYEGDALKVLGKSTNTGLELRRGDSSYVRMETNRDYITLVQRKPDGTSDGVVSFPKPTIPTDTVVYSSKVYAKNEVYTKVESDNRYRLKSPTIKELDKGFYALGDSIVVNADLRGRVITLLRDPKDSHPGSTHVTFTAPLVNASEEINGMAHGAYLWIEFTYSAGKTTMKLTGGNYATTLKLYYDAT